jgi:hypothetical protein
MRRRVAGPLMISRAVEAEILRLYHAEGSPNGTIARQLHVHHDTVRHVLWQSDVPAVRECARTSINYSRWRKEGRRISGSAVESTVNRLIGRRLGKSQHMCWSKRGAPLLLQVRCAVINGEFLQRYQRWFPTVGVRNIGLPWHWRPHRF